MTGKHPRGMGQRLGNAGPEVWEFNEPIYARVLSGETVAFEDQLDPVMRHGYREDAYFSLCYSPLRSEEGDVAGVLVTVFDTTRQTEARLRAERGEAFLTQLHDPTHSLAEPMRSNVRLLTCLANISRQTALSTASSNQMKMSSKLRLSRSVRSSSVGGTVYVSVLRRNGNRSPQRQVA